MPLNCPGEFVTCCLACHSVIDNINEPKCLFLQCCSTPPSCSACSSYSVHMKAKVNLRLFQTSGLFPVQKLQKVQISKLSSSLSRERAEAAELSEVAEMMGMSSPRNRALSPRSRAGSRPGSPGRAFRSPCRAQSRPTSARSAHPQSIANSIYHI